MTTLASIKRDLKAYGMWQGDNWGTLRMVRICAPHTEGNPTECYRLVEFDRQTQQYSRAHDFETLRAARDYADWYLG